ncbi:predicted protein [Sclerotinia sclerotiorum 1980 UF-70]|uniref:Uncharacterized protein n=1 Tax=Sclerotinia sclerotiorum (strain ATCC 18683 / 1980 / Ss-1) TaxID=665079 RepID=A7F5R5_SCLS1|nr:predicted protein [Sclerotinia sclerotiorum 1980 UF-70]EDN98086.1 predicted protein [Sclerotinia sclerotiorum 1980 UF-70]
MLLIIRIGDLHDLYGTRFRDDTWGTKLKRTRNIVSNVEILLPNPICLTQLRLFPSSLIAEE